MRKKMSEDEKFMKEALRQAKKAYAMEETPIGCVLVHEGKIIARGYNKRNKKKNTLAQAGCAGSVLNLLDMPGFNHRVEVERGILEEPCSRLMSGFFKELRLKRKKST